MNMMIDEPEGWLEERRVGGGRGREREGRGVAWEGLVHKTLCINQEVLYC